MGKETRECGMSKTVDDDVAAGQEAETDTDGRTADETGQEMNSDGDGPDGDRDRSDADGVDAASRRCGISLGEHD